MTTNEHYTNYPKAKEFIVKMATQGITSAIDILEEYEDYKKTKGEFFAARFIMLTYEGYINEIELLESGNAGC